jgi:CubicO group peptidase (beta-lactamase class C family)
MCGADGYNPSPGSFVQLFVMCRPCLTSAAVLLALATVAAPAQAQSDDARRITRDLDAWARPLVEAGHLSGQVLIAKRDRIIVERSYGSANRELGVPVTPETRFCVASITKPMTVMLALQLMQEKKLGYTDTLERWIPGLPSGRRITVEHLLRHRAGFPHRVTTEKDETQPMSAADMVEFARRCTLLFEPGARSSYSSTGFSVLARVLELASGKRYGELLSERLCQPLGLTHTSHLDQRTLLPDRATSYVPGRIGFENAPLKDHSFLVGAGSVTSTARDLHRLLQAVVTGKLGESIRLSSVRDRRVNWNGSTNGFRAFVDWDSASGLTVIYAGNVHTGAPDMLRKAVARIVAGERLAPAALPEPGIVSLPDEALRRCEGVYQLANGTRLEVRVRDGYLFANEWPMAPRSETRFFSPRDYGEVAVVFDAAGKPERLDWTIEGNTLPAPRIAGLPTGP